MCVCVCVSPSAPGGCTVFAWLPHGSLCAGLLLLGPQVSLDHRPTAVGCFPEAELCSDFQLPLKPKHSTGFSSVSSLFPDWLLPPLPPPPSCWRGPCSWEPWSAGEGQESQSVLVLVLEGGRGEEKESGWGRARGDRASSVSGHSGLWWEASPPCSMSVIDSGGLKQAPFSGSASDRHIPRSSPGELQPTSGEQAEQRAAWI